MTAALCSTALHGAAGTLFPLSHLGTILLLALLPILAVAATSFIKLSLVLSIIRSALGAPGVPPTSVLTALAAVLTFFVMAPVAHEMIVELEEAPPSSAEREDPLGLHAARQIFVAASPPLIEFLERNTPESELAFFRDLAREPEPETSSLRVLLPAFAVGETVEAFFIGFLVFLPFLVIDLIVANTLLALGMHMVSPLSLTLPLKLLLFVVVDGWHLILSGLLFSYG